MRKTTINFIKEADDGSRVCDFELLQYDVPKDQKEQGVSINQWSNAGRALFQRNYKSLANELGDGRKTNAAGAVEKVLEFLSEAALYASEKATTAWSRLCCAVSLNHLLWLSGCDHNEEAVKKHTEDMAQALKNRIMSKYDKVRCPPMTSWPIPRWCYTYLNGKRSRTKITPEHLQCLLTAYACVLSHRNGMTVRDNGDHGIQPMLLQDEARSMASVLLGIVYPKWAIYQRTFAPQEEREQNLLLRATAMPIATGLARTLIMVSMPLDAAAAVTTDILAMAWPMQPDKLSAADKVVLAAQLFAGMAGTISSTHAEALDKTCYVWTRYYW